MKELTYEQAAALADVKLTFVGVTSNGKKLAEIFGQAASGKIAVTIGQTYPFAQLSHALDQLKRGGTPGKIVVSRIC